MPYTPTGRPIGRPKTKDYRTISLKIPQDLLDRVQAYARMHRQSVSELIRDGLAWRITEGDPRSFGATVPQGTVNHDNEYYRNTEIPSSAQEPAELGDVLQAILTTVARQETQIRALAEAIEHRADAPISFKYSGNTTYMPQDLSMAHVTRQEAEARQTPHTNRDESGNTVLPDMEPAFDPARFMLGPLCQKQHDYDGQGHSLRQRGGKHECVACKNARSREYKERQRQAKYQASTVSPPMLPDAVDVPGA
jgi:hypothetical protein